LIGPAEVLTNYRPQGRAVRRREFLGFLSATAAAWPSICTATRAMGCYRRFDNDADNDADFHAYVAGDKWGF